MTSLPIIRWLRKPWIIGGIVGLIYFVITLMIVMIIVNAPDGLLFIYLNYPSAWLVLKAMDLWPLILSDTAFLCTVAVLDAVIGALVSLCIIRRRGFAE